LFGRQRTLRGGINRPKDAAAVCIRKEKGDPVGGKTVDKGAQSIVIR